MKYKCCGKRHTYAGVVIGSEQTLADGSVVRLGKYGMTDRNDPQIRAKENDVEIWFLVCGDYETMLKDLLRPYLIRKHGRCEYFWLDEKAMVELEAWRNWPPLKEFDCNGQRVEIFGPGPPLPLLPPMAA